ncbi:hypothetical protein [Bradyrhizobium sp. SZCCHNR1015]|uniref:hypothetical protein n=1 Tax=Bradyrhizobium sp. SZCCHNR1015 TaxID=3057338 RepID=UPI002916B030|nr:hypothetical protein [Bradyrhizobium sp. SZCCHNR1015]
MALPQVCSNRTCPSGYFVADHFACVVGQITAIFPRIPPHHGGALRAIVTTREAGSGGRESSQHVLGSMSLAACPWQHVLDVRTNDVLADVKLQGSDTSTLVSPRNA